VSRLFRPRPPFRLKTEMGPRRDRPRLAAMNASRAPPGVAHATVPDVGEGVTIRGAVRPEMPALRGAFLS
jgi:hypothetical protein